ncbi:unnamed protein product [Cylicocyclus nassatus]|uniref:Uncharacterized protein n=1 Tax=Cylicocyclus nassatus TaxID=53992 RepID=A0AA36DNI9_CYLNA|nr:unnamed protein product [Cylicocyclus nassatus]
MGGLRSRKWGVSGAEMGGPRSRLRIDLARRCKSFIAASGLGHSVHDTVALRFLNDNCYAPMDDPLFRRQRSNVVIRNIHEDYDAGCNGYAMDYRIAEQQRLFRASLGFLPHKAIYLPGEEFQATHPTRQLSSQLTLETSIDFRCSITTFMPMYISNFTVLSPMMIGFKNELSSLGTIVNDAAKACLTIYLTKGSSEMYTKLPNSGRNTVVMNFGDPFITRNSAIVVQRFDKLIPSHAISDTFNLLLHGRICLAYCPTLERHLDCFWEPSQLSCVYSMHLQRT